MKKILLLFFILCLETFISSAQEFNCQVMVSTGQIQTSDKKIFETLQRRPGRCTFYEPSGHHSDRVRDRLQRGLAWIFDRPVADLR